MASQKLTRDELHSRIQRETVKLISNPQTAPIVMGMGAWKRFKNFGFNTSKTGDVLTFTNPDDSNEYVALHFDLKENFISREDHFNKN